MKSPVFFNIILSVVFALVAYLLQSSLDLAIGLLAGGIVIPFISSFMVRDGGEEPSSESSQTTLYVGNLPYKASEAAVKDHFSTGARVSSVRLMKDRRTGKRKGYGFVEVDSADAEKAIQRFNDTEFQDRTLKVRLAKEKVTES